jgi:hypothetical protein
MNGQTSIAKEAIKIGSEEIELKEYIKAHKSSTKFFSSTKIKGRNQQTSKLGKTELNAMLFKLKKYFNELHTMRQAKVKELSSLQEKCENFDKKVAHIKSLNDIELKYEKISVKETSMFKESKEAIQRKIEKLNEDKKNMELKYKNELEYKNTLTHMINSEKDKMQTLNDIMTTNMEKISTIKNFNMNLDINNKENEIKSKNLKSVLENLNKEKTNLSQLMENGKNEIYDLTEKLAIKEINLKELKRAIDRENEVLENSLKTEKEKILKELKETEILKKNKLEKENEYLKLILGLDLIKKYFIDVDRQGKEINYNELLESNEYKTFTSQNFYLRDELKKMNSSDSLNNILSQTDKDFYNKNSQASKSNLMKVIGHETINYKTIDHKFSEGIMNSSHSGGFKISTIKKGSQEISKIYLKEIKEKFENLDIDYNDLMSIYSKINYKTSFYHTNMINLNMKIINFEGKKDKYRGEVKEIMSKNYKNFNDLVQNNSRFENFMLGMKKEILLNKDHQMSKRFKKDLNNILSDDRNFFDYKSQYNKLHNFMSIIKSFLEIINTFFKIIIRENGMIKDERNLKSFFKPGHKARADMRLIRNKLDEVSKVFEKFFINGGYEILPPVQPQKNDKHLNLNNFNAGFLRASTSPGIVFKSHNMLGISGDFQMQSGGVAEGVLNLRVSKAPKSNHRRGTYATVNNSDQNEKFSMRPPTGVPFDNIFTKEEYLEDLFAYFDKEESVIMEFRRKIEKISEIEIYQVRDFIYSNKNVKNKFFEINIQYEKILFYFFCNHDNVLHLFELIKEAEKFLKEILSTSNFIHKINKDIDEDEYSDKIILPSANRIKSTENEEKLYEQESDKEFDEFNSKYSKKEETTIASLQSMRRIKSVKPVRITAKDKDPMAQSHLGFSVDINKRVINKLYVPFISQKDYNKNLNKNISDVKKDTRNSAILNHYLSKKKKDIRNIAKEFAIYDNPSKII